MAGNNVDEGTIQHKVQSAVNQMIDQVDIKVVRDIKRKVFMNVAKCYENKTASAQSVAACTEKHSRMLQSLDHIIQNEMGIFENRLQRCFSDCQDSARDKFPEMERNQSQHDAARAFVLKAADMCADDHVRKLSSVQSKIESELKKIDFHE